MHRLLNALCEHRHFFLVVTLLTLVTTFPTIIYVFKTDVFWLPTTDWDVYNYIWDAWYGEQVLMGQADRHYTNLMFYPDGLSMSRQPYVMPNIIAVAVFNVFLPLSNAYNLAWLLIIFSCALSAYIYLLWLFEDKWIALLGAVVFGFSPHVVGETHHPNITYVVPIPLVLYCYHRGVREQRTILIILAGILTGLTSFGLLYTYVIILIMLGLYVCALSIPRWRDRRYWLYVALLILVVAASSFWGVYPLLSDRTVTDSLLGWYSGAQLGTDAISFFVNHHHPLFGGPLHAILQMPANTPISSTSFLGYVPLLLIFFGLYKRSTRWKMLPWAFLCGVFLILRLGPFLNVNGTAFPDILLPKYYLDQIPLGLFKAFWVTDQFMAGAIFPLAVLTGYGLIALQRRTPYASKTVVILAFIVIVAFEYHIPVKEQIIPPEQFNFIDWLRSEEDKGEVRLIHVPMTRFASLRYNLYQALSGYPHAEGYISRLPDSAYDYVRSNDVLIAWHRKQPVSCEWIGRDSYRASLAQLHEDGFSHVVYHLSLRHAEAISSSFREVEASFKNDFVQIFRLNDLRESCTDQQSAHYTFTRAYADALKQRSILDNRHGIMLVFPPTIPAADHFLHYLHHFAGINRSIVTVTSDEQAKIQTRHSDLTSPISSSDLEEYAALWLVNRPLEFDAEQTPAFQDWFIKRFHFCQRFQEDDRATIDAYLRAGIPCSAMDESSAMEVQYDSGVRLHNFSYAVGDDVLHFYLAWTNTTRDQYAYSLQFVDEHGQKALQDDKVIRRRLLSANEIDVSSLAAGAYSIQLIVYDFETHASQGGNITATSERFKRELEIAKIEVRL